MTATLRPNLPGRHYGGPDAVTALLARALGRSVGGTHQLLHGPLSLRERCVRIAALAVAAGHVSWAVSYFRPLVDALHGSPRPTFSLQLVTDAQQADADEDVAQARYQFTQSTPDLEVWLRRIDREVLRQTALRDALAGELERRGR